MKRIAITAVLLVLLAIGALLYLGLHEGVNEQHHVDLPGSTADAQAAVQRGRYLALAGNCMGCHTMRGGAEYAGGRAIQTPFGAIYSSNITPDKETGIGTWSADDFWQALHHGKSKDGTLLYPAFPYPNYTKVAREDADALFSYLMTLSPVQQVTQAPDLRFPFNYRPLLVVWRALYFRPGTYAPDPLQNAEWNRGAYLVQGLGHCNACHTARNALGAIQNNADLRGALIPVLNWYAPSLASDAKTGPERWDQQQLINLLKTGVSEHGVASGPMAEVVRYSLQHLSTQDISAIATYLRSLPPSIQPVTKSTPSASAHLSDDTQLKLGAALYDKHCVNCHKASGEGIPSLYPPLAGNRAILMDEPVNAIRAVLHGGYPPSTTGNPWPYGMPPFSIMLNDQETAAVLSFIRNAWGNQASLVTSEQVNRYRAVPMD